MGGGTVELQAVVGPAVGLSPRGRGNRYATRYGNGPDRSIPAWAGEPGRTRGRWGQPAVYPRVGGGTLEAWSRSTTLEGLSPRGRGNTVIGPDGYPHDRSIPAWAGEPRLRPRRDCRCRVYPRVGGGTERRRHGVQHVRGLSPRGRGNPAWATISCARLRSIPAWAGEPRVQPPRRCRRSVYPRVGGGTASVVSSTP